mmetsp:Transcript_839/g.2198  ORF Transcript_839/g.2198 Transcript_839/m.2198 type:complete len:206 (-) Transcript_839:623-1240(-)
MISASPYPPILTNQVFMAMMVWQDARLSGAGVYRRARLSASWNSCNCAATPKMLSADIASCSASREIRCSPKCLLTITLLQTRMPAASWSLSAAPPKKSSSPHARASWLSPPVVLAYRRHGILHSHAVADESLHPVGARRARTRAVPRPARFVGGAGARARVRFHATHAYLTAAALRARIATEVLHAPTTVVRASHTVHGLRRKK